MSIKKAVLRKKKKETQSTGKPEKKIGPPSAIEDGEAGIMQGCAGCYANAFTMRCKENNNASQAHLRNEGQLLGYPFLLSGSPLPNGLLFLCQTLDVGFASSGGTVKESKTDA